MRVAERLFCAHQDFVFVPFNVALDESDRRLFCQDIIEAQQPYRHCIVLHATARAWDDNARTPKVTLPVKERNVKRGVSLPIREAHHVDQHVRASSTDPIQHARILRVRLERMHLPLGPDEPGQTLGEHSIARTDIHDGSPAVNELVDGQARKIRTLVERPSQTPREGWVHPCQLPFDARGYRPPLRSQRPHLAERQIWVRCCECRGIRWERCLAGQPNASFPKAYRSRMFPLR